MKKLLFFFAALFVFSACDDDAIDYSTWTTEELLATPAGVEYLIKNAAPIDYAAIEEELETLVFYPYHFFGLESYGWDELYHGLRLGVYFVIDDVVRCCHSSDSEFYVTPVGDLIMRYYEDKKFTGDRLPAILQAFSHSSWEKVQIKARIENTLIVEAYDENYGYKRRWLFLVRLADNREEMLAAFPYSYDELVPYYSLPPQN